jgi:hypothetical protein
LRIISTLFVLVVGAIMRALQFLKKQDRRRPAHCQSDEFTRAVR